MNNKLEKVLEIIEAECWIEGNKILRNINLNINKGKIIGLIGPNGAGKSTTMKMIVGFIPPRKGIIKIFDYDVYKDRQKALESVDALIEDVVFYDYMSGYENLKMIGKIKGVPNDNIKSIAKLCGLNDKDFMKKKVKRYSSGMKQRLGLAKVLLGNPKFIILDEPTNALDPTGKIEFKEIIKKYRKENNSTILISSHILSEIEELCDEFIFIKKGEIIDVRENLINNTNKIYTVILKNNYNDLKEKLQNIDIIKYEKNIIEIQLKENEEIEDLIKILMERKIVFTEVKLKKASLEDVYKAIYQ